MKQLYFILALLCSISSYAQTEVVTQNLQPTWQVYVEDKFQPFEEGSTPNAIHFFINTKQGVGDYLFVAAKHPFSIFINQALCGSYTSEVKFSVDSLRKALRLDAFTVSIYGKDLSKNSLTTQLHRQATVATLTMSELRPPSFYRDYIIVAAFIVLLLLTIIIRLNPKLASDYFSVTKIFSLRESEDSIVYTRITSSGNFLFYGFSSLTIGFFLVMIFKHTFPQTFIDFTRFSELFVYWLRLIFVIAGIFMLKMLIIYLFAALFNLKDVAGMQFFNWVRLLFLGVGFCVALLVISILTRIDGSILYSVMYKASGFLLIAWVALAFFKIASKARIGLFHLFSYLCATEIIPSLFVLKILYY